MIARRLSCVLARFGRDRGGVAAIEFAIVMPLFVFGTLAMADIALRIMDLQEADAEVRLAMEGVMRYGDDVESLRSFIERNGGHTFSRTENEGPDRIDTGGPAEGISVRIVHGCKAADGRMSFHLDEAPCGRPSRWVEILVVRDTTGIFTESQQLKTLNHVRVE